MIRQVIENLTVISTFLVIWHHVGWPVILRAMSGRGVRTLPTSYGDAGLPTVSVVMPAHNEALFIGQKIRNLAALDYPPDLLEIIIVCDGCSDPTVDVARRTLAEPDCLHLRCTVLDQHPNLGKVAVLNKAIAGQTSEIVALTDVSAMLPADALRRATVHYADPRVGAVGGTYSLGASFSAGEAVYWKYQVAVKLGEAALGAPLGMHGAFWTLRRAAWAQIAPDTINDDFIMPMEIFRRGWGLRYDTGIVAVEAEASNPMQEDRRRRRIAAGNAQQAVRQFGLLHLRNGGVALAFGSGKVLRVLMPFLMVLAGLGAAVMAPGSAFFSGLAAAGSLVLAGAAASVLLGGHSPRVLSVLRYIVAGNMASALGVIDYVVSGSGGPWMRADSARPTVASLPITVRTTKRAVDVAVASVGLVAALPLLPLIWVAIRLDSPGPAIFRQLRVGRVLCDRTEMFMMCKFRSMCSDAERRTGAVWALKSDPRVTRVGEFLRKTRLDEIPQLWNVLKGDMSVVGPRPERPGFYKKLEDQIPFFADRTVGLRPGITGFAQVCQGYDTCLDDVRRKVAMDHAYAMRLRNLGSWLLVDAWVMLRTVAVMVGRRGQ